MKQSKLTSSKHTGLLFAAVVVLSGGVLLMPAGCGNNDFLGLEDFERDILVWFLLGRGDEAAPPCWDLNGNGVSDPEEDINGDNEFDALDCQGRNCWDLNGNGVGDPEEDINGDEQFDALDCQALDCWDLNGNRVEDPEEDINGDGVFDALDC